MKTDDSEILSKIGKFELFCNSNYTDVEFKQEYEQLILWLRELCKRRNEDCEHELISIKNQKIDSGFMCIHCGKIFGEHKGEPIKTIRAV